jgi:hypothetical protein
VHFPRISAAAAALSALCLTASAGVASAATTPTISQAPSGLLTFVPPSVGPLSVSLGATIIGGKVISPAVNVTTTGTTLPPISWTPPSATTFPINGTPVH